MMLVMLFHAGSVVAQYGHEGDMMNSNVESPLCAKSRRTGLPSRATPPRLLILDPTAGALVTSRLRTCDTKLVFCWRSRIFTTTSAMHAVNATSGRRSEKRDAHDFTSASSYLEVIRQCLLQYA